MNKALNKTRNYVVMALWILLTSSLTYNLRLSSISLAGLSLLFFLDKNPHKKFIDQFKNAYTYIFILPFLLSLAGMINTENLHSGWHYVEVSLSLFIFPFVASDFKKINIKKKWQLLFSAFIAGILLSFLLCLIRAFIRYPEAQTTDIFFYVQFTRWIMAPNYLSNYVIFGIAILTIELTENKQKYLLIKSRIWLSVILGCLILFLFLLASKASLIILALLVLYFFIYWGRHKILSWMTITIIFLFTLSGSLLIINQTMLKVRLMNMGKTFHPERIDYSVAESTTTRISAFIASSELIKKHWYLGVGTGDVRKELTRYYKQNQYIAAYKLGTHPHNQMLRSFLAYGIAGILSMLLLFYMLFKRASETKNSLIYIWASIMFLLFLTDDMICIHAGVIYFSMFSALFTFALNNNNNHDSLFTTKNG